MDQFEIRGTAISYTSTADVVADALNKPATYAVYAVYRKVAQLACHESGKRMSNLALGVMTELNKTTVSKALRILTTLGLLELRYADERAKSGREIEFDPRPSATALANLKLLIDGALKVSVADGTVSGPLEARVTAPACTAMHGPSTAGNSSAAEDSLATPNTPCTGEQLLKTKSSYSEALTKTKNQNQELRVSDLSRMSQAEMFEPPKPAPVDVGKLAYALLGFGDATRPVVAADKTLLRARLKRFTPEELQRAVTWAAQLGEWHATDETGRPYLDLRTVCFSDQVVEALLRQDVVDPRTARLDPVHRDAILAVFERWKSRMAYKHPRMTDERIRTIERRLREGFTAAQLCQVVDAVSESPFHTTENPGKGYDDLPSFLGSATKVTRWLERVDAAVVDRQHRAQAQSAAPVVATWSGDPDAQAAADDAVQATLYGDPVRPGEEVRAVWDGDDSPGS